MPLDHLLAALEREARASADRVRADAQAEAARLTAGSEEAVARRRDLEVARVVPRLREEMERKVADARRTARGKELAARERLLGRIEEALRRALPAATARPEYLASLPRRVATALACVGPGEPSVCRCPAVLVAPVRGALPENGTTEVRADADVGSGFRLETADGALEIEDTLEGALVRTRTAWARNALRQLEPTR